MRLEEILRREVAPEAIAAAAREYREVMAERPDALRLVAAALNRIGDRRAAIEVLRTLIIRGEATRADRFLAIDLMLMSSPDPKTIDDATYQANLTWLKRELEDDPDCRHWMKLADWTEGRPEELVSIDGALARCKIEVWRWELYKARLRVTGDSVDACHQVVNGGADAEVLQRCLEAHPHWRVEVAKAMLGHDRLARLRTVVKTAEVTSFALQLLASTPGASAEEACAALARAEALELNWYAADERSSTMDKFDALRRERACK